MQPHEKGDLTEAIVVAELKKRGIPVLLPFGDNQRYDVVVQTPEDSWLSLQIKAGQLRNGVINFNTKSQHTNSRGNVYKSYDGDIDYFLVYFEDVPGMYLVGVDEFDANIRLRDEEPEQVHKTINWAEDYEFDSRWSPDDSPELVAATKRDPAVQTALDSLKTSGATVYRELSDTSSRMLIVSINGEFYRTRIETGWMRDGRVRFQAREKEAVDCYLVHCEELDTLYAISFDEFRSSISLRVEKPERHQPRINYAREFEFERNWPPGQGRTPRDRHDPAVRAVIAALTAEGYQAEFPEGDETKRTVAVPTENGRFRLRAVNGFKNGGLVRFEASDDRVDFYAIYYEAEDQLFLVPDDAFEKSFSLRVDPTDHDLDKINWAEDYRFSDNWPPV